MVEPDLLETKKISVSHVVDPLIEAIRAGEEEVFYSCGAVSQFGLPQGVAFKVFVGLTRKQALLCSLTKHLWEFKHEKRSSLPQVDPLQHAEEELIFYRPKFEKEPQKLFEQTPVRQIWELEEQVIRPSFPDYRVGPPLREQKGSEYIRERLRRGIEILKCFGLIELETVSAQEYRPYSHSSLFLLTSRSLGLPRIRDLREFQDNPAAFLAMATISSLIPKEKWEERDFVLLEKNIHKTAKLKERDTKRTVEGISIPRIRFPEDIAWHILGRIEISLKDYGWFSDLLSRMSNQLLLRDESNPLHPQFDIDAYTQLTQYQKVGYVSRLIKLSNADIGKIVGENPETVQAVLAGNALPSSSVQENMYWLLMLFSGLLRLSQYNVHLLVQLLGDTEYFSACSIPPPWYPDTLRNYISLGEKEAVKKAVKWLKNN